MRLDEKAFSKKRFWYLFSAAAGLWLLVLLMLMGGCVSAAIELQEQSFKKTMDKKVMPPIAGRPANEKANKKEVEARKKKIEVWDVASKSQGHILAWPGKLEYLNVLPWGTALTGGAGDDHGLLLEFKDKLYPLQFEQQIASFQITNKALASMRSAGVHPRILSKLEPLKDKSFESRDQFTAELKKLLGEELESSRDLILHHAQLINQRIAPAYFQAGTSTDAKDAKGGFHEAWRSVLKPMAWKATPSREECWIVQEDYCVRLTILDALAEAMQAVARFQPCRDKFRRIEMQPDSPQPPSTTPAPPTESPTMPAPPRSMPPAPGGTSPPLSPTATSPPESQPPKLPKTTEQVFRNSDWELRLAVVRGAEGNDIYSGEATLKNINTEQQKLDLAGVVLTFRQGSRVGMVKLTEGAVNGGKSVSIKLPLVVEPAQHAEAAAAKPTWEVFDPRQPMEIEQVGFSSPAGEGFVARLRLKNPNWELDLKLDRDPQNQLLIKGKSTIKNINAGLRPQDLSRIRIRLEQKDRKPVEFDIKEESLDWDKHTQIGQDIPLPNFDPAEPGKPIQVEQIFTWDNAPIRRIDQIEIGNELSQAHGPKKPLHPARPKQGEPAVSTPQTMPATQPEVAGKQAPMPSGSKPGAQPLPTPGGKPGAQPPLPTPGGKPGAQPPPTPGGKPGAQPPPPSPSLTAEEKGPNDINYHRYVSADTQYVRRLPVALVLVVEPGCVQEVLTALANSRLRFHTRQIMMRHAPRFSPAIRGVKGNEDPNLVILTIFGEVSLYNPPPKRVGSG